MPATMSSLGYLPHRFAGFFEQVTHLYEQDQTFRDLCDVHAVCVRAVKRSEASQSSILAAEYEAQQRRLEAHLLSRLPTPREAGAHPTGGR
jgi:hypothetical protein